MARRACCLAAVALRGLASQWDEAEQAEFLPNLRRWVDAADLHDEVEPWERETLETPAGELELQEATDATWRWEGAAVLAAALGRFELPPYDQSCDPKPCGDVPIDRASPELIGHLASITQERHVAANWLIGWDPLYGEVATPT